jgi:hypothetical protein
MNYLKLLTASLLVACLSLQKIATAQANGQSSTAPTTNPSSALPFPAQLKKTVVFIEADCEPTPEELAKLTPGELGHWFLREEAKMKPESLKNVKHPHSGTGFLIKVTDSRLGEEASFIYLVTNRHVAQPGIEDGKPCNVHNYFIVSNVKDSTNPDQDNFSVQNLGPDPGWTFSDDQSVDLAVLPIVLNNYPMDYMTLGLEQFVTPEMIDKKVVVEDDPVVFAGLFIQFQGRKRLEPIVRSGTLAMIPSESTSTTLKRPGYVYFAEAHSHGGNSGSPMLVDIRKFAGPSGYDYRFLGVVSGFVPENNDFTLQVSTDYQASIADNSGICVVVPAEEVRKILFSPKLQVERDNAVATFLKNKK